PYREQVEVRPRGASRSVNVGTNAALVPVRVVNRGTHALVPDGPARTVLRCRLTDADGRQVPTRTAATFLPRLLMPGRALSAVVPVPVPDAAGTYRIAFWAERAGSEAPQSPPPDAWLQLVVGTDAGPTAATCCAPLLEAAQTALAEAERVQRL